MPEAAQNIHDTKDLEHQVGDLLNQMEAGTQRLAAEVATAPTTPPAKPVPIAAAAAAPAPQAPPSTGLEQSADDHAALDTAAAALIAGTAPGIPPAAPPKPADPPAGSAGRTEPPGPDLASAVEKLLDETSGAKPEPTPATQNGKIDSLDAELAGLADELIAGELQGESAVIKDDKPAPAPVIEAPKPAPVEPLAAAPVAAPKPAPELVPEPVPPPATPKEPADLAPKRNAPATTPKVKLPAADAEPGMLLKLLAAISAPLQSRPHLRDMLGWVALVQAFFAMCIWVWVLFVRSDKPVDPPPVAAAKEPAESGHADPKKDAHGSHASTAKKSTKQAKKSASAGAHH